MVIVMRTVHIIAKWDREIGLWGDRSALAFTLLSFVFVVEGEMLNLFSFNNFEWTGLLAPLLFFYKLCDLFKGKTITMLFYRFVGVAVSSMAIWLCVKYINAPDEYHYYAPANDFLFGYTKTEAEKHEVVAVLITILVFIFNVICLIPINKLDQKNKEMAEHFRSIGKSNGPAIMIEYYEHKVWLDIYNCLLYMNISQFCSRNSAT